MKVPVLPLAAILFLGLACATQPGFRQLTSQVLPAPATPGAKPQPAPAADGRFIQEKQLEWECSGPAAGTIVKMTVQFGMERTGSKIKVLGRKTTVTLAGRSGPLPWEVWVRDHAGSEALVSLNIDNDGGRLYETPAGMEIRKADRVLARAGKNGGLIREAGLSVPEAWVTEVLASFWERRQAWLEP